MSPVYKFELSDGVNTQQAFPVYKDDLSLEYTLEQGEQFYRAKLTGDLTFQEDDFWFITKAAFDTSFAFKIYISYNRGASWAEYWSGQFWKTDCKFDEDNRTVAVKPDVRDRYNEILAGLEKEYDLIQLAPEMEQIRADKRPMVQVYVPGETTVGCYLSGMWWEQECEAVTDQQALQLTYHFGFNKRQRIVDISGEFSPALPPLFMGEAPVAPAVASSFSYDGYTLSLNQSYDGVNYWGRMRITRDSDGVELWRYYRQGGLPSVPYTATLDAVAGSGATGSVNIYVHDVPVYARYVTDVEEYGGTQTSLLPTDDMVSDNRNYSRAIPYIFPDDFFFSQKMTSTPTRWGIYQPGEYYADPVAPSLGIPEVYPVCRNAWSRVSIWFAASWLVDRNEANWRKEFTIRDSYPLSSAISRLLSEVAPGITFEGSETFSRFLYGTTDPLLGCPQKLFITPKSNVVVSDYDQPAQKAPVTLRQIFNMLRDCFRCFWFIDDQNRLRIEHIQFFRKGGSYTDSPAVGVDLTQESVLRNGKPWSYARSQYQFDKPEMVSRYQFGWMDDVTEPFIGHPIDIISRYVEQENIETVSVGNFTSDIDFILLNPEQISMDGFVLLGAVLSSGSYKLPYVSFEEGGIERNLQNGYLSFSYLQQYYMYDMPGRTVEINGERPFVYGIKKLKKQEIRFPAYVDPDPINLIKTSIGEGTIQKISINLQSRNANTVLTYEYDV